MQNNKSKFCESKYSLWASSIELKSWKSQQWYFLHPALYRNPAYAEARLVKMQEIIMYKWTLLTEVDLGKKKGPLMTQAVFPVWPSSSVDK